MNRVVSIVFLLISSGVLAQSMDSLQALAYENNPGLKASYKEFESAMTRVDQVSALADPTLSFGYFISPVETRVGPQRAKLSLTQMFPWFGTLKASGDVATYQAEASYQRFLDQKAKLGLQVSKAYIPLIELNQLIQVEEENLIILESYKRVATAKFENGEGSLASVLKIELLMDELSTNIKLMRLKQDPLNEILLRTIGVDSMNLTIQGDFQKLMDLDSTATLAEHPSLSQFDSQSDAAKAKGILAQKQGAPKIGIGLDYVIVGERTDMAVDDNGKDVLMPMVSVSLPIFRSKYRAAQKEASIDQEWFEFAKINQLNQLQSQWEMTQYSIEQQQHLISLYQQQEQKTNRILKLQLSAYSNSGTDFEELLKVHRELLSYQKALIKAKSQLALATQVMNYITFKPSEQ